MEITPELLAHIESLAVRATPSPWIFQERDTELHSCDARLICSCHAKPRNPVDIDYIQATSPELVLSLINKILCLEKEADWLAGKLVSTGHLAVYREVAMQSDSSLSSIVNFALHKLDWREVARKFLQREMVLEKYWINGNMDFRGKLILEKRNKKADSPKESAQKLTQPFKTLPFYLASLMLPIQENKMKNIFLIKAKSAALAAQFNL